MSIWSQNPLQPHRSVRAGVMTELSTRSAAAQVPNETSAAPSVTNVPNVHWTSTVRSPCVEHVILSSVERCFGETIIRCLRELDCLSELDLRDMGLTKAEISFLAWSEARRRYEEHRRSAKLAV